MRAWIVPATSILATKVKRQQTMATHGSIGEFQGNPEGWTEYIKRLERYFTANDGATNKKRRAIFLACCGDVTYSIIRSLAAPRKPTEIPYNDFVKLAQAHYNPRPSQIVQRLKFNSRTQQAGESIASYVAELRRLSEHCECGPLPTIAVWSCLSSRHLSTNYGVGATRPH